MGKPPAFQLYAADFYMDTVSWDVEVVGFYFRLLMCQWVNGSIPNDLEQIARITGCLSSRKWRANVARMWSECCHKFATLPDSNNLINERLEKTRKEQETYSKGQSESGLKGVEVKKLKGIYPFNKSSDPSSDPSSENQALLSSSSSSSKKKKIYTVAFEAFWSIYPRKFGTSKLKAFEAWEKLNGKEDTLIPVIMSAIDRQIGSIYKGKEVKWIPHAATWLNEKRWEGEDQIVSKPNSLRKALF
jgi:uncharacterized protein YdaU (DUF1376 family)